MGAEQIVQKHVDRCISCHFTMRPGFILLRVTPRLHVTQQEC